MLDANTRFLLYLRNTVIVSTLRFYGGVLCPIFHRMRCERWPFAMRNMPFDNSKPAKPRRETCLYATRKLPFRNHEARPRRQISIKTEFPSPGRHHLEAPVFSEYSQHPIFSDSPCRHSPIIVARRSRAAWSGTLGGSCGRADASQPALACAKN